MSNVIYAEKPPRCPLCHKPMELLDPSTSAANTTSFPPGVYVAACQPCRVAIRTDDPYYGRWEEMTEKVLGDEKIPCPLCGEACTRLFFTALGYLRARCARKKCKGASVTLSEPDRAAEIKKDAAAVNAFYKGHVHQQLKGGRA